MWCDTCWVVPHESLAGHCCGYVIWRGPHAILACPIPLKVLGFLDVSGDWIPDLALVMGGALIVSLVSTPWVLKHAAPRFASQFHVPTLRSIDQRLAIGAYAFWSWLGTVRVLSGASHCEPTSMATESTMIFCLAMVAWHAARGRPSAIKNSVKHNAPRRRHHHHCIKKGPARAASRYPSGTTSSVF
jgi:hypothetical protein